MIDKLISAAVAVVLFVVLCFIALTLVIGDIAHYIRKGKSHDSYSS